MAAARQRQSPAFPSKPAFALPPSWRTNGRPLKDGCCRVVTMVAFMATLSLPLVKAPCPVYGGTDDSPHHYNQLQSLQKGQRRQKQRLRRHEPIPNQHENHGVKREGDQHHQSSTEYLADKFSA